MILPRTLVAPLALLVALATATVVFNAGVAAAPTAFFGGHSAVIIGPSSSGLPGQVDMSLALVDALGKLENVTAVSPEIYALIALDGRSVFVRGVAFEPFMRIEGARVVEGRMPTAQHEALVGEGLARHLRIDVPQRLLLPSSFERLAIPVDVVGIATASGPARDELLVDIDLARQLMDIPAGRGHVIRVETQAPAFISSLVSSHGPVFTYSDVRVSADDVIPGEPVTMRANLTNWGPVGGVRDVEVMLGSIELASRPYFVEGRQTVGVEVEFFLENVGVTEVTINPTLPLTVRAPSLVFAQLPEATEPRSPFQVTLADLNGSAVPGVLVSNGVSSARTDAAGRAELVAGGSGLSRLTASIEGDVLAVAQILVVDEGYEQLPHFVPQRIAPLDPVVTTNAPVPVRVLVENRGGVAGIHTLVVLVDNQTAASAEVSGAPGSRSEVELAVGPLAPGSHEISVAGSTLSVRVRAFAGEDPRVEALLEGYERATTTDGPASTRAEGAESYITRVVGEVRAAVLSLSVASGTLAALGAFAVLRRHISERGTRVAILKSLGASDQYVLARASREAAIIGSVASLAGLLIGIGLAQILDSLGIVWAFGHAVHPNAQWHSLALIFVLATTFIVVATRLLVRTALDSSVDALLRGGTPPSATSEARDLADVLKGAH